jgi:hypothetical protein
MKKPTIAEAEHLRKCLKKITLKFLKTGWGTGGIKDLEHSKTMVLGSDKMLYSSEWKKRGFSDGKSMTDELHCAWSEDHDRTLTQKRRRKLKHIFVSQMCDVAVAEYAKVCKMLGLNKIILISFQDDKEFFKKSKKLLKIPGVKINTIEW